MEGKLGEVYRGLAELAADHGVRLGIIGGFSSLRLAPGGPRLIEGDGVPAEYYAEAKELADIADELLAAPDALDWFYVSPPAGYGSFAPGQATGTFRVGSDVVVFEEDESPISGADFAAAIIAEIEQPKHHRSHFSVKA